jgi:hypothetical protein
MRRLYLLLGLLVACGCTSDGKKRWYSDALDDAAGKNMEMKSGGVGKGDNVFNDTLPSEFKSEHAELYKPLPSGGVHGSLRP